MGWLDLLRELGALLTVLGLLVGVLWLVRRHGITLPGVTLHGAAQRRRRLEIVERLAVDGRASLTLIRRDGHEHLLLLTPQGALLVEANIPAVEPAPVLDRATPLPHFTRPGFDIPASLRHIPAGFAALVEKARATSNRSPAA